MAEMSRADEALTQANTGMKPEAGKTILEVSFHVIPTVAEDKLGAVVERVRAAIEKANGKILSEEFPKRLTLAYRIERSVSGKREKYTESWFGFIKFEAEGEGLPELQKTLTADYEVLRFLLVEATLEEPKAPRAVFASDRLEGETIRKPGEAAEGPKGEVSEEELDKSLEALVN